MNSERLEMLACAVFPALFTHPDDHVRASKFVKHLYACGVIRQASWLNIAFTYSFRKTTIGTTSRCQVSFSVEADSTVTMTVSQTLPRLPAKMGRRIHARNSERLNMMASALFYTCGGHLCSCFGRKDSLTAVTRVCHVDSERPEVLRGVCSKDASFNACSIVGQQDRIQRGSKCWQAHYVKPHALCTHEEEHVLASSCTRMCVFSAEFFVCATPNSERLKIWPAQHFKNSSEEIYRIFYSSR